MHVAGLVGEPPDVSNWPHPAAPDGNPFVRSTAPASALADRQVRSELGKAVFWDEQLSADNTMSCGTCHIPSAGGTDNRKPFLDPSGNLGAVGVLPQHLNGGTNLVDYGFINPLSTSIDRTGTGLHTPTMIGAYVFERQFWDMRAGPDFVDAGGVTIPNFTDWAGLEDQVAGPPISPIEMGHEDINWVTNNIQTKLGAATPLALVDPATVPPDIKWIATSGATYDELFDKIFHADPQFGGIVGVTRERISLAMAHYMRTLIPDQAPIDLGTMTPEMIHGFKILDTSGCFICHSASGAPSLTAAGTLADPFDNPLSDGRFHNIGFGAVKTPTLRNVGLRARFFSTGQGAGGSNSLDAIIKFYDQVQGGILGLDGSGPGGTLTSVEFKAVSAFLGEALTDPRVKAEKFPFDRPELASERPEFVFEANEFGVGTPGPSGNLPEIIANSPPLVPKAGPPHFKIGVGHALGSTPASLLVSTVPGPGPVIWVGPSLGLPPMTVTNPMGIGTLHAPFALSPGIIGVTFYTQWVVHEFFGPAHSNAAKFTPFQF
ncbi:MAG: cytochrome-c peroxidase [Planctomycetota bacterium]